MKKDKKVFFLECFSGRYVRSKQQEKSKLLDELCDLYELNRNYIGPVFNYLTGKNVSNRDRSVFMKPMSYWHR